MRYIQCDVCEEQAQDEVILVTFPEQDPLDVCSADCLSTLARVFAAGPEQEEPQEPKSIRVPEEPPAPPASPVFMPRDEHDIEAVTGVVRRGSRSS